MKRATPVRVGSFGGASAFVWGLEGDIAWSNVKGSTNCGLGLTCETSTSWFATARGRVGYAFDRFMPYITGGAAFGDVEAKVNPLALSASDIRVGWTAGAGLEYAFLGNWTAKIEYLYMDLGTLSSDPVATALLGPGRVPLSARFSTRVTDNILRLGVNYKF